MLRGGEPQRLRPRPCLPGCHPSASTPAHPAPLRMCRSMPAPVPRARLRPCRVARPAPSPANAQMGSSPFQVSAPIFFFSLFPATGKIQKNYLYIFFFYKNLFSSIFFNSHPINLLKFIFLHFLFQFCTLYTPNIFLTYFLTHPCANHQAHINDLITQHGKHTIHTIIHQITQNTQNTCM